MVSPDICDSKILYVYNILQGHVHMVWYINIYIFRCDLFLIRQLVMPLLLFQTINLKGLCQYLNLGYDASFCLYLSGFIHVHFNNDLYSMNYGDSHTDMSHRECPFSNDKLYLRHLHTGYNSVEACTTAENFIGCCHGKHCLSDNNPSCLVQHIYIR